ncbi:hypothetical protein H4R20_003089, partial [Coemansia guatemalensis]
MPGEPVSEPVSAASSQFLAPARSACKLDPTLEHTCSDANDMLAVHPSGCFPIQIKQAPGRGRGFFATRDIAPGEVIFRAVPVAWSISESWVRNTCWWCFAHDSRRPLPIKAAPAASIAPGSKHLSHARYKGVFCSDACLQSAECAYGGRESWDNYLMLLNFIEADVISLKTRAARKPNGTHGNKAFTCTSGTTTFAADHTVQLTSPDSQIATFSADLTATPLTDDFILAESDFDLGSATDEQLAGWIATVWDLITTHHIFATDMPNEYQRELTRLVASVLFLRTNNSPLQLSQQAGPNTATPCNQQQQSIVVSANAMEKGIAPLQALDFVKSNET